MNLGDTLVIGGLSGFLGYQMGQTGRDRQQESSVELTMIRQQLEFINAAVREGLITDLEIKEMLKKIDATISANQSLESDGALSILKRIDKKTDLL